MMLRPKDNRDLPAKKKTFETNIFFFFLERASVSNFMAKQIKIIQVVCLARFTSFVDNPGKLFSLAPPYLSEISTF